MAIRPDCIERPANPVDQAFVPSGGVEYQVQNDDTWENIAKRNNLDERDLLRYNYPTLPENPQQAFKQVNWYLQEYVGCKTLTVDQKNYRFSGADTPGVIYLPPSASKTAAASSDSDSGGQCVEGPPPVGGPVLTNIKDRRDSILKNTPGVFQVAPNPAAKPYANPVYARQDLEEVTGNLLTIDKAALRYDLNPDFVRAIVWMESTHGWYDRYDPHNKTIRPMNVHAKLWEQLGITRADLDNPELNIEAGVYILAQIWARTENPNYEKVAALYNMMSATKVDGYGKTIVHYMQHRPWLSKVGASKRASDLRKSPPLKTWKNR